MRYSSSPLFTVLKNIINVDRMTEQKKLHRSFNSKRIRLDTLTKLHIGCVFPNLISQSSHSAYKEIPRKIIFVIPK